MTGITAATPARRLGPPAGVILIAVLALLAAACGGSPSAAGPGGSSSQGRSSSSRSAVGYSACMRSHGVLSFPDPDSSGHLPKADPQQLGVSASQLEAAQRDCQHVLPNTGASFRQQTQQCSWPMHVHRPWWSRSSPFSGGTHGAFGRTACRTGPTPRSIPRDGRTSTSARPASAPQYTHSSAFASKDRECERLVSGSSGGVPVAMG